MDHVGRFARVMADPDPPLDLALALVAATGRPQVDPAGLVGRLDELAEELAATADVRDAGELCAAVFGPGGFTGDREDYYDPRNSLLDEVLARRTGIPISLAVVAIEVGRRLGIRLVGVGMPGHFLIGRPAGLDDGDPPASAVPSLSRWFDGFDRGRELDVAGCAQIFDALHGGAARFDPAMLAPVGASAIVDRVLNNLLGARARRRDRSGVADVLALRAAVAPGDPAPLQQLATALGAAGRFDEAAAVHEQLSTSDPAAAADHLRAAGALRARLN